MAATQRAAPAGNPSIVTPIHPDIPSPKVTTRFVPCRSRPSPTASILTRLVRKPKILLGLGLALWGVGPRIAIAATSKALVQGELSAGLRQEIVQAVGETAAAPESVLVARQRAREAAADAVALLRSEGYYGPEAVPDVLPGTPPRAVIRVIPGQRFRFSVPKLAWEGEAPPADLVSILLKEMQIVPGSPARAQEVLDAEGRIVGALQQHGYADAEARPREVIVDHADRTMTPTFRITAADLVHLGPMTLTATGRTHVSWLRRLKSWKTGATYSPAAVAKLEQRLIDTGVYESVTVALAPKDQTLGGLRPVLVSVADRPARTLELGAGYSTTRGSGVDGKVVFYNRLGRADTLTLSGRLFDIQQKLDLELALPDFGRADQILKVGGGPLADRTAAYDDLGGGVRMDLERHFTKTTYITVGAAADYAATREKNAVNLLATPVGVNLKLAVLTGLAAFALDRSNDPLNPRRGWRLEARVEPTLITGDRKLEYLKAQSQVSAYLPLQRDASTVLAARIRLGAIFGGSIPEVPADRRYYAGGGASVRGFGYQAVGSRLSDNTPIGGLSLVETSFEVRQKLTSQWGIVGFVDAGTIGSQPIPHFRALSIGAGIGVRYDLGFGPFRLDLATPINPQRGDGRIQISVSIGQSF